MNPSSVILLLAVAVIILGATGIIDLSWLPVIGDVFGGREIRVGIYGDPSSLQVMVVDSLLKGPDAKARGIKVVFGPKRFDTALSGAFEGVDILVVIGENTTSLSVRETLQDYMEKGGKLILTGDSFTQVSDDPAVHGWGDLDVPVRCIPECRNIQAPEYTLEVRDYDHPITRGLSSNYGSLLTLFNYTSFFTYPDLEQRKFTHCKFCDFMVNIDRLRPEDGLLDPFEPGIEVVFEKAYTQPITILPVFNITGRFTYDTEINSLEVVQSSSRLQYSNPPPSSLVSWDVSPDLPSDNYAIFINSNIQGSHFNVSFSPGGAYTTYFVIAGHQLLLTHTGAIPYIEIRPVYFDGTDTGLYTITDVYIYNLTRLAINSSPTNPIDVGLTFTGDSAETYEVYMQSGGGCFDFSLDGSPIIRKNVSHGYFNYSSFTIPTTGPHSVVMDTCSGSSSPELFSQDAVFVVCAPETNPSKRPGCEAVFDCSIDPSSNYRVTCKYDFNERDWSLLNLSPSDLTLNVSFASNNPGMPSSNRPNYFSDGNVFYADTSSFSCTGLNCRRNLDLNYKEFSLRFSPTTNVANPVKQWNELFTMNLILSNSSGLIGAYPLTIANCSGRVCTFPFPVPVTNGTYNANVTLTPRVPFGFLGIEPMSVVGNFSIALEQVVSTYVTSAVERSANDVLAYLVHEDVRYAAVVESDRVLYFSFNPALLRNRFIDSVVHLAGG